MRIVDAIRLGAGCSTRGCVTRWRVVLGSRCAGGAVGTGDQRTRAAYPRSGVRSSSPTAGDQRGTGPGATAVRDVRAAPPGWGLELRRGEIIDLRNAGIIDAAEVVHVAAEAAVSIAKTALRTEVIVAHRPPPPVPKRRYGHHHGHDHGHFGRRAGRP